MPYPKPHPPLSKSHTAVHKLHERLVDPSTPSGAVHQRLYFQKGLEGTKTTGQATDSAFNSLIEGLHHHDPHYLSKIKFEDNGGMGRKLVNPQAGFADDLSMPAPWHFVLPSPPEQDGKEETAAAEMVELYWMSELRDVPFAEFSTNSEVANAVDELKGLNLYIDQSDPNHPSYQSANLSTQTVFRGGDLKPDLAGSEEATGPYLSQFLTLDVPFGTLVTPQKEARAKATDQGIDGSGNATAPHMTTKAGWLEVQGGKDTNSGGGDGSDRRMSTMMDLARYVHIDGLYEAYLHAALLLIENNFELDPGNPYGTKCPGTSGSGTCTPGHFGPAEPTQEGQEGFGTFGPTHILSLVADVASKALKTVWFQKWVGHLRLRPEAFAGIAEELLNSTDQATIDAAFEAINSSNSARDELQESLDDPQKALAKVFARHGSLYLPMVFAEGSPMHPAYGAGHATVAGACVTVLKAFFNDKMTLIKDSTNEDADVPERFQKYQAADGPAADFIGKRIGEVNGTDLNEVADADELTVGGELDKLAANISIGRNMAGVHWRSDYTQSILLGQRMAASVLFHQRRNFHERPWSMSFTTFGGNEVKVEYDPAGNQDGLYYRENGETDFSRILGAQYDTLSEYRQRREGEELEVIV